MTDADKLNILRSRDNYEEKEDELSYALLAAKYAILTRAYPFTKDFDNLPFPPKYDMLQIDIANVLLRKSGIEGQTIHIENGIHRHFETSGIPETLLSQIVPQVGVI